MISAAVLFAACAAVVTPASFDACDAVRELTNALHRITGRDFTVCTEGCEPSDARSFYYIGDTHAARTAGVDVFALRRGDWRVKTVPGKVFLVGRTPESALFAVTWFLEKRCGYLFLDPDGDDPCVGNPNLEIPESDDTVSPTFYLRSVSCGPYRRFARARRAVVPEALEGEWRVSRRAPDCHASFAYLPPERYFKDHPEYYSMGADGRRHGTPNWKSQLCYTNPETYRLVRETLFRFVAEDRAASPTNYPCVYDLSQQDFSDELCLCPECRRVIAKYDRRPGGHDAGGDAGLQLEFVNRLACDVRKKYPDVKLRVFGYASTGCPPRPGTIRPEPNVIVWWCDRFDLSDHTVPLCRKGHFNGRLADEIRGWRALTPNVHVWDYLLNGQDCPEAPVDAIASDARFFAELGVPALYLCGDGGSQPFFGLNFWLVSNLWEDPRQDVEELVRMYCRVYGRGAEKMHRAIGLLRTSIRERPARTPDEWHSRVQPWRNAETLGDVIACGRAAFDLAERSAERRRIARVLAGAYRAYAMSLRNRPGSGAAFATARVNTARFAREAGEKTDDADDLMPRFRDLPHELTAVPARDLFCADARQSNRSEDDPKSECERTACSYPGAPCGYPVRCGFTDWITKKGVGYALTRERVPPDGKYHWVWLGVCRLGGNTTFRFPGDWRTAFRLSQWYTPGLAEDDPRNRFEAWASVRVRGPSFGRAADGTDAVCIDRLVLRRRPAFFELARKPPK